MIPRAVRLGCSPAKYDPSMPKVPKSMRSAIAPKSVIRSFPPNPQMFGNDKLGDCTAAGMLNGIEAVAALGKFHIAATTDDAVNFYSASTGYVRGDASTDRGGYEVDVLKYAALNGVKVGANRFFPVPMTADPYDFNQMRLNVALFGFAYLGVELAISDMGQAEAEGMDCVWDTNNHAYGDPTPGSEGGHCLNLWEYTGAADTDVNTFITWGGTKVRGTNRWLRSRIMEQHAMLWPQLAKAGGGYPTGDTLENLKADADRWSAP